MTKVSVITAVYNGEAYFDRAPASILAQTMDDFEWLIVDDGSTDTTPERLCELAAREPRVRVLTTQEPYDVVHSHVYSFTGFILRLAVRQGIPMRIAHVHTDRRAVEVGSGLLRQCQLRLMKAWIQKYAVVKVAVSGDAAEDLFGAGWRQDPRGARRPLRP